MKPSTRQRLFRPVKWIDTGGGPFVLLPAADLAKWEGLRGASPSDFDRACDVGDYLGVIPFEERDALVLGDAPFPTAFVSGPTFGGGFIVRMLWGHDLREAARVVHRVSPDAWGDETVSFDGHGTGLVLFDAAHTAHNARDRIHLPLGPGRYAVSSADWEDEDMCLLLHRLVPVS